MVVILAVFGSGWWEGIVGWEARAVGASSTYAAGAVPGGRRGSFRGRSPGWASCSQGLMRGSVAASALKEPTAAAGASIPSSASRWGRRWGGWVGSVVVVRSRRTGPLGAFLSGAPEASGLPRNPSVAADTTLFEGERATGRRESSGRTGPAHRPRQRGPHAVLNSSGYFPGGGTIPRPSIESAPPLHTE